MTAMAIQEGRIILAIDPGKTTGWAILDPEGVFHSDQVAGRFDFYRTLRALAAPGHPLEVVIEAFTITARTSTTDRQYDALYIIGYVEAVCEVNGWDFTTQSPGSAKAFASNDKLAAIGWRNPTPGGHADDAARHLLTYLATHHPATAEPLLRKALT